MASEPLSDTFGYGVAASRPTAAIAGRVYFATDTGVFSRDNGSSWDTLAVGGNPGAFQFPTGTGSITATEGYAGYDSDDEYVKVYDGQRERIVGAVGWTPTAWPLFWDPSAALTTSLTLAANGGSVAIPMVVPAHMLLQDVALRSNDTATARTWGWDLYINRLNNGNSGENTANRVANSSADETFTPAAASNRFVTAASAPIYLGPGVYWLVVQCRHATNNFAVGSTAGTTLGSAIVGGITKTTTNPNGSTLDLVAATWTKQASVIGAALRGRVLGMSTVI